MSRIHVLPEQVANKIAAGEVIERPASIAKELIENALDAAANSIDVEIKHGGKSLIRVADNGCGMSRDDVELSIQRHATSKIADEGDLDHIASFGFRGEALASISAVSRTRILTRAQGESVGTELVVEGGKVQSVAEKACREGTIIEVRDLFFNTPARRKFLRTDATERGHILDVVAHMALPMLHVGFSFRSMKKEIQFAVGESLRARAVALFGADQNKDLLEFDAEEGGIRVSGLIGKPSLARANRTGQIFFVNQRWVKTPQFAYAVQDAYHGMLMHGQFPVGIVFLELGTDQVDVNVHPNKKEVRFSQERMIKGLIRRVITERLMQEGDLAPRLMPRAQTTHPDRNSAPYPDALLGKPFVEPAMASLGREAPITTEADRLAHPIKLRERLSVTKVMGQIHGTFIVAETEEGMILIDQHAAHERVMFEELLEQMKSGNVRQQRLLLGEMLELHPKQEEILGQNLPMLQQAGYDIEKFGEEQIVVRAVPAVLGQADPIESLRTFLEQAEAGKLRTQVETKPEDVAAMIACKRRSVKAHDALTAAGMQSLLEQLATCENPFNCPHGRPTLFKLSFGELERQFKRK